jgi:2'-5' RNA ligase
MYSIISELDEQAAIQVMHLWRLLHDACGLEGIFNYPNPHFTWFGMEDLNLDQSIPSLEDLSKSLIPFSVHTDGLGVFPGEKPVLYLPLVKSAHLVDLHREIWDKIRPFTADIKDISLPEFWVPHITLALQDLNRENLVCAIDSVGFEPIEVFCTIDNLLIVKSTGTETGDTVERFRLTGLEKD